MQKNNYPLTGIIVLDMTNVLSGPFATQILADMGAEVIKIEKPDGDDSRSFGPFVNGKSSYFISLNRGKKSIVLDLKSKKEKGYFNKLLSKADILIDNFKPGTLEKYGFSKTFLKQKYPRLIQTKISGFGETGPMKKFPAYDMIVQAMGGIMSITGKNKNQFSRVGSSIGDIVAGLYAVIGILIQLINRNKTNEGSRLDLSMLDCQVAILENAISRFSVEKKIPEPLGTDHPSISPFGAFKTSDSLIVIAVGNDKMFQNFCNVVGDSNLAFNEHYKTNFLRNKNLNPLRKKIEFHLKKKSTQFWLKKFKKNNIPSSKINNIKDLFESKQIKNRGMIFNYKDESIKKLMISGNPLKFSFFKNKLEDMKSPELNEDRNYILKFFNLI